MPAESEQNRVTSTTMHMMTAASWLDVGGPPRHPLPHVLFFQSQLS